MEESKIIGPWKKTAGPGYPPCPICGGEVIVQCRCFRADSTCVNGHDFHICVKHQVYVRGHSSHKLPIDQCTCGQSDPRVPPEQR